MDANDWYLKLVELKTELQKITEKNEKNQGPVELDQTKVGRLSRMDALQGQAMSKAVAARRAQSLMRIEAALTRLEDEEFGFCLVCGDEIQEKRLLLDPAIVTCQGCSQA